MKKTFILEDLCCANCAAKIEADVKALEGVTDASVNFITTKMIIEGEDGKINDIVKKAKKIVKKIEPDVTVKEI